MAEFSINTEGRPFSLPYTLESGQAFRWSAKGDWWYGVLPGGVVKLRQEGAALTCHSSSDLLDGEALFRYFGLDDDLDLILASIMKDQRVTEAVQSLYGLRIMKQEVWECLLSFAIATNSNIPRIKQMISRLSQTFGQAVDFEGERFWLFPDAESLADASVAELAACGLGYRARFVKSIGEAVHHGRMNLEELKLYDYPRAKERLTEEVLGKKSLMGIGPKVADCVLLFSCDKTSAFPIDVWIARVLAESYPHLFDADLTQKLTSRVSGKMNLSEATYQRLSEAAMGYFGEYAGYAQQYLFHHARTGGE